jgi:hypothetical protein
MADKDEDSMFPSLSKCSTGGLTIVPVVSDLQEKEAEETEQKIINEGESRRDSTNGGRSLNLHRV